MAKNVFFNDDTMKTIGRLAETGDGKAIVDYGKDNFLLGAASAAVFALTGYTVYKAGEYAVQVWKYLKS